MADDEDAGAGIVSALGGALAAQPSYWTGAGAAAWAATLDTERDGIQALLRAAGPASSAARAYAAAVDGIQREAATQIRLLDEAQHTVSRSYLDSVDSPPTESQVRRRERDHADAATQLTSARSALGRLADQRRAADDALVASVTGSLPSSWPAERAAFLAFGIAHPERLSAAEIDHRVDDFLETLDARGRSYTAAEASALLVFAQRGELSPERVLALLTAHPTLARKLSAVDPAVVAEWWRGLDDPAAPDTASPSHSAAQLKLVKALPEVLGNLDGVAYWARDQANQATLTARLDWTKAEIARMEAEGAPYGSYLMSQYIRRLDELRVDKASCEDVIGAIEMGESSGSITRQLISFSRDSPPLGAVSIGDLDTASNVTYMVPGMGSSTKYMSGWVGPAQNLYDKQSNLMGQGNHAVVAWIGYTSPPLPSLGNPDLGVLLGGYAEDGAQRLIADLSALTTTRRDTLTALNVVGHSYGTTVASRALAEADLGVASFVSVASAGIERWIPNVNAIHATHVYAEQAKDVLLVGVGDNTARYGRLFSGRADPMQDDFGAERMNADGVSGDRERQGVNTHSATRDLEHPEEFGYFDKKTESLDNIGLATTGRGDEASRYTTPPLTPFEEGLLNSNGNPGVAG
ncbi:hypothetical protein GCM10025780_33900 [Frondihabitans cladoniiphilus]|uniref:DUF1023 domain-containing protein n=1 Tax=Frondihabitans cladoniiphilus TaxID=715785 RepID=A0ABP8WAJ6_9MICO